LKHKTKISGGEESRMRRSTLCLLSLLAITSSTYAQNLTVDGRISFHTNRNVSYEVYDMNTDGSDQTGITSISALEAAYSPDGKEIVFRGLVDGNKDIYSMGTDGSNLTRLTTDPTEDHGPAWSPDGQKIVYGTMREGTSQIYVMDPDGSNETNITNTTTWEDAPSWSPDGEQIVFRSKRDGNREIYVMNADGTNQVRLTNDPSIDSHPSWSPDGSRIYFNSYRSGGGDIWSIRPDGTDLSQITSAPYLEGTPSLSPEGTRLAIQVELVTNINRDIYTVGLDGSGYTQLTTSPEEDANPDWAPFLNIGKVESGGSVTRVMTIRNTGTGNLEVTNISFSSGSFYASPSSVTVPEGETRDVDVSFAPSQPGTEYTTITLTSNDVDSPTLSWLVNGVGPDPFQMNEAWVRQPTLPNAVRGIALDSQGNVYYGGEANGYPDSLYSYSPDGSRNWARGLDEPSDANHTSEPTVGPAGNSEQIYVTNGSGNSWTGKVYAYATDGTLVWQHDLDGIGRPHLAVATDGTLYVAGFQTDLHAFSSDGTTHTVYPYPQKVTDGLTTAGLIINSKGELIFGTGSGKVFCFDPSAQVFKWNTQTGGEWINGIALDEQDNIYVTTGKNSGQAELRKISADGATLGTYVAGSSNIHGPALGPDGAIYFGGFDHKLYGLTSSLSEKWPPLDLGVYVGPPAIAEDGVLYVAQSHDRNQTHSLFAVDASTGAQLGSIPLPGWTFPTMVPRITSERLYIGAGEANQPWNLVAVNIPSQGLADSPWPMLYHDVAGTSRHGDATDPADPICVDVSTGLVSWYAAEGDADDEGLLNDAVLQNGASFAPGKVGDAFSLDGQDDFVQVPSPSGLPVGNAPRTMELWFQTDANLQSQTESAIIQYGTESNSQMFGLITSSNAPGRLYFFGHANDLAGTTVIQPGQWYHAALTHDGSTVRMYVNGILEASKAATLNTVLNGNGLTLGYRSSASRWDGLIDETSLYDRALTDTEIRSIYLAGSAGKCELPDRAPVADAGEDQSIPVGEVAQLDGSGSSDPEGLSLTHSWRLTNMPSGSSAFLSDPLAVNPTFTADAEGSYTAELIVTDPGGLADTAQATVTGVVCTDLASGAVSWWKAEGDGLDAVGGNDGSLNGGATTTTGLVGNAFTLDGQDDHVQVVSPTGLPLGNAPRTMELWFNTNQNLQSQTESALIQYGSSVSSQMFGLITSANAPGRLYFFGHANDLAGSTVIQPGRWYHAAVTYDGVTLKLFMDGTLEASKTTSLNTVLDGNGLTIGFRSGSSRWAGQLDEPTIYNRALSDSEVLAIFQAGAAGKCIPDLPPVADAGVDQSIAVGDVVQLDGSGSSDPEGLTLTYSWSLTQTPPGSAAYLTDPTAVNSTFTVDVEGEYRATLTVTDPGNQSDPDEVVVTGVSCADLPSGAISWWPGEGNAVDKIGGNDGIPIGGTTFVPGLVGEAFSFDGVDDLVTTNFVMNYASGVSLETWVRLDNDRGVILADGGGSTIDRGFGLFVEPGGIVSLSSTYDVNGDSNFFVIGPSISDGKWHHVAGTWTGGTNPDGAAFYVDGVLIGTTTAKSTLSTGSTPFNMGWHAQLPGHYKLKGQIDEPAIYGRSLSESEVTAIFNAGPAGKCEPPNQQPIADAGPDQTLKCLAEARYVTLDGSGSSDPGNAPLSYSWTRDGNLVADTVDPTVLLPIGTHTISLVVNNGTDDSSPDDVVIAIEQDNADPVVTITSPNDGVWTRSSTVAIRGTVLEAFRLKSVTVNGKRASFIGPQPNYSFSKGTKLASEGANPISVEVIDLSGNVGTAAITVNRDTQRPEVAILSPAEGTILMASPSMVSVSGTVSDVGSGINTVTVNGVVATIDQGAGTFSADVILKGDGTKKLRARATDVAGNRKDAAIVSVVVDAKPPTLTITSPTKNAILPTTTAVVIGTVRDNGSGVSSVTVNGEPATIDDKQYEATITLGNGAQLIEVIATDLSTPPRQTTKSVAVQVGAGSGSTMRLMLAGGSGPIPGARVDLLKTDGRGTGKRGNTGADGSITLELPDPANQYLLRVIYNGLIWKSAPLSAGADVPLAMETATLTYSDGVNGIEGARVDLLKANDKASGKRQTTGPDGKVSFEVLPDAGYGFKLTHNGETASITGSGGSDEIITTVTTTLTLFEEGGTTPIPGVRVDLLKAGGKGTGKRLNTEADGKVAFDVLNTFTHAFKVTMNGGSFTTGEDSGARSETVVAQLSTVTLIAESGVGIGGARVDLLRADGKGTGKKTTTAGDGVAGFQVLPGSSHAFKVSLNGGSAVTEQVVGEIDATMQTALSTMTVTNHSGDGISGVRVDLMRADGKGTGKKLNTDANGVSGFEILPEYAHAFKVSFHGGVYLTGPVENGADVGVQTQLSQIVLATPGESGGPVEGARIDLLTFDGKGTGRRTNTDENGLAGFETLPGCNARFKITHNGDSAVSDLVPCGSILELQLAVTANTIIAHLTDRDGGDIEGARVDLLKENGKGAGVKANTDTGGMVEFTVVPSAKHFVKVSLNGGAWTSNLANAGDTIPVQTGKATLSLKNVAGDGVDSVWVYLLKAGGKGTGKKTKTGRQGLSGKACFQVLDGVSYRFKIVYNGGTLVEPALTATAPVGVSGSTILTEVQTVPTTLTLTDSGESGINNVWVYLLKDNAKGTGKKIKTTAVNAIDGIALFDVLPTIDHRFKVVYRGGTLITPDPAAETPEPPISIPAGGSNDHPLQTEARVISVLDGGVPLGLTRVDLLKADGRGTGSRDDTDAGGFVTFEVLSNFEHKVRARVGNAWHVAEFTMTGGGVAAFDIQFPSAPLTKRALTKIVIPVEEPLVFGMRQNFPNPFNPSTTINYTLAEPANVHLVIYSVLGQHVRSLVSDSQQPGRYQVVWDGRDAFGRAVSTGMYLYRIEAGSEVAIRKMQYVK
jgi:Tol biopolymer transport system component